MKPSTAALVLLGLAIVVNVTILLRGEEGAGLPIIAIAVLGAAGTSLLVSRRER